MADDLTVDAAIGVELILTSRLVQLAFSLAGFPPIAWELWGLAVRWEDRLPSEPELEVSWKENITLQGETNGN